MSQPSEVGQVSPKKRRRRLLAIFGFIAIVALSLGLALTAYPSFYPAQTSTFNTCQQFSTIFSNNSTTTINNCQQLITGLPPLGGVTSVVSSSASSASSASTAATTAVTFVVTSASTHEYHPKLSNGEGNIALPSLGIGDPPALASPTMISGVVTIHYADGSAAVLSTNQVTLNLCAASCVSVTATLKQTSTGTYTYTFTPPSLTGTVTIYIAAGSLVDEWGRILPSVDTQIGTYTPATPTTTGTSQQERSAPPAGTPPPPLTNQAVNTNQIQPTATPVNALLPTLSALTVAGSLLILPVKRRGPKKDEDPAP